LGHSISICVHIGVINVLTTTPLWVVNTRLKMRGIGLNPERNNNEYTTLWGTLALRTKIIREYSCRSIMTFIFLITFVFSTLVISIIALFKY